MKTRLTKLLAIEHPIIQAPMAGGTTPAELIAAACNAGALGSLGAAYLSPEDIESNINAIRKLTDKPFAVNLFTYHPSSVKDFDLSLINDLAGSIGKYCHELGIEAPTAEMAMQKFSIDDQLAVVLAEKVPVLSCTFGIPTEPQIKALRRENVIIIGSATTRLEACQLEQAGVDAIVAQGCEAGGHRGTFAGSFETSMIGLMALVPQVVDSVKVPVIAAGGIMDGRGLAAAFALGAEGVQMGTAFLLCQEANIQDGYRKALVSAEAEETKITSVFSGRPARGIKNRFMEEMEKESDKILPFPITDSITKPMRAAARSQSLVQYINMWAGQAGRLGKQVPVAELIERVLKEAKEDISTLSTVFGEQRD